MFSLDDLLMQEFWSYIDCIDCMVYEMMYFNLNILREEYVELSDLYAAI